MKLWPHFDVLAGSMALLILSVAVPCVPAAPPTPEPADAGVLRAPAPSPKRGGVLKWGGARQLHALRSASDRHYRQHGAASPHVRPPGAGRPRALGQGDPPLGPKLDDLGGRLDVN